MVVSTFQSWGQQEQPQHNSPLTIIPPLLIKYNAILLFYSKNYGIRNAFVLKFLYINLGVKCFMPQLVKQPTADSGVALIGTTLVPLLSRKAVFSCLRSLSQLGAGNSASFNNHLEKTFEKTPSIQYNND